ncbi:MAG: hypothetical protein M1382_00860 [Candidatus Marsarchaeota archaeon]|nr:hypothetical protein [Candidatus Marsarchaeota archaeon]
MQYIYNKKEIIYTGKKLTMLDKIVIDFLSYIDVDYVIVSGYVAILFGRDRHTEDVDMFIRSMNAKDFSKLFNKIISSKKYYCINAEDANDAYNLLKEKSSIRFAEKNTFDPNFEIKFPQNELNRYSLDNTLKVVIGKNNLKIGSLELQLVYKLYLGSEKDYEDAAHLYTIFKDDIDKVKLSMFIKKLHIKTNTVKRIFRETI